MQEILDSILIPNFYRVEFYFDHFVMPIMILWKHVQEIQGFEKHQNF